MRIAKIAALCAAAVVLTFAPASAQTPAAPAGDVIGVGNFLHIVSDADKSVEFYQGVLGMDLQRAPNAPADAPRVYQDTPAIVSLYNAIGGRYKVGVGLIQESPMRAELVEWSGVERHPIHPRFQEPGAGNMILSVRELDPILERVKKSGSRIVTTGGKPISIDLGAGPDGQKRSMRMILLQDPDGFFVELLEPHPAPAAAAQSSNNIYKVAFGATVYDTDRMVRIFHDALGFDFKTGAWMSDPVRAAGVGVPGAVFRRSTALVPGTDFEVELLEFKGADRQHYTTTPRDPGTAMLRLVVRDIDTTIKRLNEAGAQIMSKDGVAAMLPPNGAVRAAIARTPDDLLIQVMQRPAPAAK